MVHRYLLDTNILSEPFKRDSNPSVLRKLQAERDRVCTAAPVWHELRFGCERLQPSKRRRELEYYLKQVLKPSLTVLAYDSTASEWHANERARLSLMGRTPAFVDGQIASIAKTNGLVLVTRNMPDFDDFDDLDLENWFD